jgi:hypothetical protein
MASTNIKVRSGNRVLIKMDGQIVGAAQSVRMSDDYAPDPASGIGDIHVLEHVPTVARHSLQVTQLVLYRASMRQMKVTMENGDAVLRGIVFDICTVDRESGEELRKYTGCSYASGDIEVNKHAIISASASFNALDVSGEVM